MNGRHFGILLLVLTAGLCSLGRAQTLDAVLAEAQNHRAEEKRLLEQRRDQYLNASEQEQGRLTQDADTARAEIQRAVQALTERYSANELEISGLNQQLRDQVDALGLGELFGLARQVAGDSATFLQQSLISAQLASNGNDRVAFLRAFAQEDGLASPAQLERLWLELQQEMTAAGQVARFEGAVVRPDGAQLTTEVVRIGPFTAVAEGRYLSYLADLATLGILPRQLPEEFLAAARELQAASAGYLRAAVDPTRGVLTGLYVERPSWAERVHQGELVGYVILTVGVLGALAFIYQLGYLLLSRIRVSRQMRHLDEPARDNSLGRVLLAFKGDARSLEEDAEVAELRISEAVMREMPALERFQAFLRLAVAAGPLLGLVGTVVGMIMTFQSITESGSSDPRLMAAGIGQAMIATVLGLGIAVPLLFANALLNSLSRSVVQILDEQSTGLLAETLEKRGHA